MSGWVTAIGQEQAQTDLKPLLGIPDEMSVLDIMCFGAPAKDIYKRWKKDLNQIASRNRFNMANYMTVEEIDDWVANKRHLVMYKDESKID